MNNYLPDGYSNITLLLKDLNRKPEQYWQKRGEHAVLKLFHAMATRVPGYKDFLKKQHIDPEKIKTIVDFSYVPPIDKQNYLREYSREALCWDGEFANQQWVIAATSGSTGEPFYFPRQEAQDSLYAQIAELYLLTNFEIDKRSTLYIVGFPMGVWIGGLFTYEALKQIARSGKYQLSVITPGINKLEIIKAIKNLGPHFDQVVIGSYAPFLKDILDDGETLGLDWKKHQLGFVFSAEAFSETFRDYVAEKTGIKNVYKQTLNHYGTVDMGTMAHETPLSILIRRCALQNTSLYQMLFGQMTKLPTFAQYNPEHFYFESVDGSLYCSAFSGIPLVRYDLKDHGGIITYEETMGKITASGINFEDEIQKNAIAKTVWKLPFVYVYERSDFSVSFFAFQIYPETVRKALQQKIFSKKLTGKFTMLVSYDERGNQLFTVHVELKRDIKKSKILQKNISEAITQQLLHESSEYRKTHEEYGERVMPHIVFWAYEDPTYFRVGVKQKWVKK